MHSKHSRQYDPWPNDNPCPAELYNVIEQYAVELPESSPFLSMPSRKGWILHGQSNDSFGFKYWLGFNVSRGTGEYTPATQHAEVSTWLVAAD